MPQARRFLGIGEYDIDFHLGRLCAVRPTAVPSILLCGLLALLAGCSIDEQDVLVTPELATARVDDDGGWRLLSVFACGKGFGDLAAWSAEDILWGGDDGTILRIRPGRIENIDLSSRMRVMALATGPDGSAYAADMMGVLYRLEEGEWLLDGPSLAHRTNSIWCDRRGAVTTAGRWGQILRRVNGVWSDVDLGIDEHLRDIWGNEEGQVWIAGERGRIVHYNGASWKTSVLAGGDVQFIRVIGDTLGRLALLDDDGEVYFHEGAGWRVLTDESHGWRDICFYRGRLLGLSWDGFRAWNGEDWEPFLEGPDDALTRIAVVGDALVVADYGGAVQAWSEDRWTMLSPQLGSFEGLTSCDEGVFLLTRDGRILRREGEGWILEDRPGTWAEANGRGLAVDKAGTVTALVSGRIHHRVAGAWQTIPDVMPRMENIYAMADRSLCFAGYDNVWILRDGIASQMFWLPDQWKPLISVSGPSLDDIRVLLTHRLCRFDDVALRSAVLLNGPWQYDGLAYAEGTGWLLFERRTGLFVVDEDGGMRDVTPLVPDGSATRRARIRELVVATPEVWYAWDDDGLFLRRTPSGWEFLRGRNDYLLNRFTGDAYQITIAPLPDGRILMAGTSWLLCFEGGCDDFR
jgi:hypothetical protein